MWPLSLFQGERAVFYCINKIKEIKERVLLGKSSETCQVCSWTRTFWNYKCHFYHLPIDPRAQTKPQPQSWCLALTLDLRSSHFRPAALCVLLMGHFSPSLELLIGSSPCLSPLEDPVVAGAGVGLAKGAQTPWKSH